MNLPRTYHPWLALGVAVALTAVIQLFTNTSAVEEFSDLYTIMAENGLAPHPQLVAPCAYRFVSPMLAGFVSRTCGVSTSNGFFIVSMASSVGLLWLTYHLTQRLGATLAGGQVAMAIIALSIGHLKNNLYFNNSMEGFTQALMIVWLLAMFKRRWWIGTALCVVGLCTREVFLIPTALLVGRLAMQWLSSRAKWELAQLLICAAVTAAAFVLPRLLIPVAASIQLIDPLYDRSWFTKLLEVPLNWKRDLNLMIGIASYFLPLLMLLTVDRCRLVWRGLQPFRRAGVAYCSLWLPLTLWGGTDLYRYVTYLFLPLVYVVAILFRESPLRPRLAEISLALVAMAIHNKIFSHIPAIGDNLDIYLDFWPAFEDRLNRAAGLRVLEICVFLLAARGLRLLLARRSKLIESTHPEASLEVRRAA